MKFRTLEFSKNEDIATLVLNRPEAMNAMNFKMFEELEMALKQVEDSRVLIVRGKGKAFSSGADIELVNFLRALPPKDFSERLRYLQNVIMMVEELSLPVIAAINGYAVGGGLDLALACDLRIATEEAKLGEHYVRVGVIPDLGGTQRLARVVGLGRAKEMIFLGEMITALEAERIGLVNRVVPQERFELEIRTIALQIATGPSVAHRMAKRAIHGGLDGGIRIGMEIEVFGQKICMESEDVKEGILSFHEKRLPRFQGK